MYHDNEKDKNMGLPKEKSYILEDILHLPDGERAELIDGQIYYFASPNTIHQRILMKLAFTIQMHIENKHGLCEVFPSPFGLFLEADKTYLEPDICVICDPNKISHRGCEGAPDLIIEIISESTKKKDYGIKLLKYRTAGVKEYWIVNPFIQTIQVFYFEDEVQNDLYSFSEDVPVHIFDNFSINLASLLH